MDTTEHPTHSQAFVGLVNYYLSCTVYEHWSNV